MKIRNLFALFLFMLCISSCNRNDEEQITNISARDLTKIAVGIVIKSDPQSQQGRVGLITFYSEGNMIKASVDGISSKRTIELTEQNNTVQEGYKITFPGTANLGEISVVFKKNNKNEIVLHSLHSYNTDLTTDSKLLNAEKKILINTDYSRQVTPQERVRYWFSPTAVYRKTSNLVGFPQFANYESLLQIGWKANFISDNGNQYVIGFVNGDEMIIQEGGHEGTAGDIFVYTKN